MPPLADDPALTLQAISNYQTAAEAFASGGMRMPERLPQPARPLGSQAMARGSAR